MPDLAAALDAYRAALNHLSPPGHTADEPAVLRVLLARDALDRALAAGDLTEAGEVAALNAADQQLKTMAPAVTDAFGTEKLSAWRATSNPAPGAWWWSLDAIAAAAAAKPSPLWAIFAGFCLTLSLTFTAEIARRFLVGDADFVGIFSTIVSGLLTLLAGSTLTQAGAGWIERLLADFGVRDRSHNRWKAGLALLLLLTVLGFRLSLPAIARLYNDRGVRQQMAGQPTSAITSYERAVSLAPDMALAHYNLAGAYEDVLAHDKALAEYQTALQADPQMYVAYNNLARLYMLRRSDFNSALALLNSALMLQPAENTVQYSLYKNRGWAHFGLKLHRLASADLKQALALRPEGAAAHCLLAQVLEAQGQASDALPEWESCLAYAAPSENVEANWYALAQERVMP